MYNVNTSFNTNGTLVFQPKRLVEFIPERSVGNPDVDVIMSPNIPLLVRTNIFLTIFAST